METTIDIIIAIVTGIAWLVWLREQAKENKICSHRNGFSPGWGQRRREGMTAHHSL